jgi:HlyD family secretion protein/adhesin transport system membrane fusion protein
MYGNFHKGSNMIGNTLKKRVKNIYPRQRNIDDKSPLLSNLSLFIEERHFPHNSQITILIGCVLVISFFLWACIPLIEDKIHLNGHIIHSNRIKSIQHTEGGIIDDVKIRDGEYVEKGQVLLTLENKGILTELEQAFLTEVSLKIRTERLRAFALGQSPNFDAFIQKYQDLVLDQLLIYEMQIKNWGSQKNSLEKQQERQKALLAVQLGQEKALRERLTAGSTSKTRHELDELLTQIHKTRHSITEYDRKLNALKVQLRNKAIEEMDKVTIEIAQVKESIAELQNRLNHLEIKAPISGVVKGLDVTLLKGFLAPDVEIMKIFPKDAWEVEIRVSPQEIRNIKIGQIVILRTSASSGYRYAQLAGEVKFLSKLPFLDREKKPYFKAYIAFRPSSVTNIHPATYELATGTDVQVDIHAGKKSLIQYLITPICNRKA